MAPNPGFNRDVTRARSLARTLRVLAAVVREPGLTRFELAGRVGTAERTLTRDLQHLRRLGFAIVYSDGYQLQERFDLAGGRAAAGLAKTYAQLLEVVRAELPHAADAIAAEVEVEAPAALAALVAEVLERYRGRE